MVRFSYSLMAAVGFLSVVPMASRADDRPAAVELPAKEKFHLYLLMGQSNMAGRGKTTDADKQPHARVLKRIFPRPIYRSACAISGCGFSAAIYIHE